MEIKKKINLDNNIYYISVEVEYEKHIEGFPTLRIKNYKNKYWDSGAWSLLIEKKEKAYKKENANLYDKSISFMADILYIYDRIPFISKITEVSKTEETVIGKEEIENYIKTFNIRMHDDNEFKLYDERSWFI